MVRRIKLRTLEQCAFDVSAEYSHAEGLESWLSERPGVELVTSCVSDGHWKCVLRRDGLMVAVTDSLDSMSDAIVAVCRMYEMTRPASEYDATWSRGPGWKPPEPKPRCAEHNTQLANLAFFSCGCRFVQKK